MAVYGERVRHALTIPHNGCGSQNLLMAML